MKKLILVTISFLTSAGITIAQDKWQNTVFNSFGSYSNHKITSMNVFNGQIYAGTASNTGELYRSPNGNANSWTQVFSQTFVTSIDAISSTTQGGGYIYISGYANGSDNPRIYRSADGSSGSWTSYYESYDNMPFIFPFKGTGAVDSMYIVRDAYPFGMILKAAYDNNDPSNSSNTFDTVLNLNTESPYTYVRSYTQYNNKLYVGTSNGKIWKSSADGNTWKQDTLFQPGFGNSNNNSFTAMASFGGYLYVGTENYSDGAQIWRSNDDATWTQLSHSFGSGKISSLNVMAGELWATFENCCSGPGQILKSTNGTTFTFSDSTGFGIKANHGVAGSTILFGNQVYYGFENTDNGLPQMPLKGGPLGNPIYGGQIWRMCTGALPVVNLGADKTVCGGVSVTFDAGTGVSAYLWSDGSTAQTFSAVDPGDYYVTVTGSNGCQSTDTVTLINKATPHVMITNPEGPVTLCKNDTLAITTVPTSNLRITLPAITRKINDSILDYQVTTDTLTVSGINDDGVENTLVSVTIDSLYHPDNGELVLMLFDPSGAVITLSSNNGYGTSNYIGTTFSMNASTPITSGNGPFTGTFIPQDPFSYLNGFYTNGKWVLQASDYSTGNQGVIKGWSIKFSEQDTIMTYSWTPATGLLSTNKHDVKAVGINSVKYALTTTNTIGCSSIDTITVNVPKMKVANSSVVACYGSSALLSATGGNNYYWSPSAGLNNTIGDSVLAAPTADAKYYVRDTVPGFGCVLVDSVMVKANPQLTANAGPSQTICFADTAIFTALATGGTSPYTYSWNTGSTKQTIKVSPIAAATYTLTAIDNGGCKATSNTSLSITPSTDIYGHVDTSGTSVTKGNVVIYKYLPYKTHFDTIQVQPLDAAGKYHFTNINHGNYLIEVFADTLMYPKAIPTYYGNQSLWNVSPSEIAPHDCNKTDTFNIKLINVHPVPIGPGRLSGNVYRGAGFGNSPTASGHFSPERSDPIPGVDVKLGKNPGGSSAIVAETKTDSSGYHFNNLSLNTTYVVFVDIPGLGRDSSYVITPTISDSVYINLDYIADSTTIHYIPTSTTGIKNAGSIKTNEFSVYPNPSNGNATIEYQINADANVSFAIYNVLGVKVYEVVNNEQHLGTYKYTINTKRNNLSPGVYFITLNVGGKTSTNKIIITE